MKSSYVKFFLFITALTINYSNCFAENKDFLKTQKTNFNLPKQLPKITVVASSQNEAQTNGYKTNSISSATRTDTRLIDIPQSVAIVTQEQIRDQNISNMEEAVRYIPGVNIQQGESNRDQISIRGNSTSSAFFIDGARDDLQYFRDFYNVERIEFINGPNALSFGRGSTGGVVNRVSKTADGTRKRQVIASGGSFNNRRMQIDLGDKVNDKLSFRLNSMYEKSGTFRQFGDLERYGFNPTFGFKFNKDTDAKFGYEHFSDSRFNDRGIPSANGTAYNSKPSQFFGNPKENTADAKIDSVYLTLNHSFDPKLKLKNYTRYTRNSKFYQNVYAATAVDSSGNLTLNAYNNATERDTITNQTDLTKKFETGSLNHTALLGTEFTKQNSSNVRNTGYFNNSTTSITISGNSPIDYTPLVYRQSATDTNNYSEVNVRAAYLQDQIDINQYLQIMGGLRYDSFEIKLHNNRNGLDFSRTDNMVSPRAGIVIKPKDSISLYGSYSVNYLPSSGEQFTTLTTQTAMLKPEKLANYEVGTKWEVNKDLILSTALYQLDRMNSPANDPNNSGYFLLTGRSRTRGVEFSANGKITNQLEIIASYTLQDAIVLKQSSTTGSTPNNKLPLTPRQKASIWNKYSFDQKFAVGLGIINQSSQFASLDNSVKLKGFTRFDAAFYYKINQIYKFQINVENLFDRGYIQTAHNNNNIQPGSPRAFKASVSADF